MTITADSSSEALTLSSYIHGALTLCSREHRIPEVVAPALALGMKLQKARFTCLAGR